ncbi:MAG TPA: 50S ribosomal protein L25 [Opitutae bacterium]|nr:50S ribosomal protein L25 [Opitutae bacterium]|tara:strand:+ start:435 stop:1106 length:672 start_codon:yes stop_codon:yes gene_type:complete
MSELSELTLQASPREKTGRNACNSIRNAGKIPVILYGKDLNKPYSVDGKETRMLLRRASGTSSLFRLLGKDGEDELVLIKDLQKDQIKDKILHIDFIQVTRGEDLQTKVPLVILGEASGVKNEGGILEVLANEIEIKCRPSKLPSQIDLDISALDLGSNLQIRDLADIDGVTFMDSPEMMLVSCVGSASGRSDAEEDDGSADVEDAEEHEGSEGESEETKEGE